MIYPAEGEKAEPYHSVLSSITLIARPPVVNVSKNSSSARYARQRFLVARRRGPNNSTTVSSVCPIETHNKAKHNSREPE